MAQGYVKDVHADEQACISLSFSCLAVPQLACQNAQDSPCNAVYHRTVWKHAPIVVFYATGSNNLCSILQLGVHRSSSIANSVASSGALSTTNRVNSDSSDSKYADAATAQLKEVTSSPLSWSERKPTGRVRSVDVIPEFAPVREESTGEKSDADTENSQVQQPEPVEARTPRNSHEFAVATTREGSAGVTRKAAESAFSKPHQPSSGKSALRRPVHVGFVQPY